MASPTCPYCGAPVAVGAAFCARCGRALTMAAAPAPATPPPPGTPPPGAPGGYPTPAYPAPGYAAPGPYVAGPGYSGFPPGYPMASAPVTPQVDGPAMGDLLLASIILFIGAVIGFFVPDALGIGYGAAFGGTPTGLSSSTIYALLEIAAVASVATFVAYFLFRRAFVRLRSVDPRFHSIPTFALVLIIGLLLLLPALVAILSVEISVLNCAGGAMPIPMGCFTNVGGLLGGLALFLVALVLLLVGYIGVLVGIFRLGTRYDDTMFKVAACVLIIPYVNVVGLILLMIGIRRVQARFGDSPPGMAPPVAPYRPM